MNKFIFLITFCALLYCQRSNTADTVVFWDGRESVASYADRVNLPLTQSVQLSAGVRLEFVLIPAGKFVMGTSEPNGPKGSIALIKFVTLTGFIGISLTLCVLFSRVKKSRKFSFSLRMFMFFIMSMGLLIGGIVRWRDFDSQWMTFNQSLKNYKEASRSEKPAHFVTITHPFYMSKYSITQEQYEAVSGVNPSYFKGISNPVEFVTYDDAIMFCANTNKIIHNHGFPDAYLQLPTEAQWEYACRAGTTTAFNTGEIISTDDANIDGTDKNGRSVSRGHTMPCGSFTPNAFGLYDMHGNVFEFCQDYFEKSYYSYSPAEDPIGPDKGQFRVLRGGSFESSAFECRSSYRNRISVQDRADTIGFRVVLLKVDSPVK